MTEVEIKLIAPNQEAVKSIRQVATESQKLHTASEKQQKRQIGLITDIEKELSRLQAAQKNAMTIEHIEKYNKKIAEAKKNLDDYNKVGLEAKEKTESLTQSIGKWALGLGVVTTATNLLKTALKETMGGMLAFNVAGAAMKQVLYNIVTGVTDWNAGVAQSIVLAKQMNDLRLKDRMEMLKSKQLMMEYNKLYTESIENQDDSVNKIAALTKAKEKFQDAIKIEIESTKEQLSLAEKALKLQPLSETAQNEVIKLVGEMMDLYSEQQSGIRRISRQIANEEKKIFEDVFTAIKAFNEAADKELEDIYKEENDKKLKKQKEYLDLSQKLIDEFDRSNIASLSGVEKLRAIRDFGFKQIAELRAQLEAAGTITKEQDVLFMKLGQNVIKAYLKGMAEEADIPEKDKQAISKALLSGLSKLPGLQPNKMDKVGMAKESFSVWKLLGIDPDDEDGKKAIDNLKTAADEITKIIDDTYQRRVDDAERTRSLLDTRVNEAQSALEAEIELYKSGYAANVAAKQKELDDLKAQREKALKDEEKALKAQRTMDALTQTSSLLTASANIFKGFSKLPVVGQALAVAAIGAMFAAFENARVQANKVTKLAKGGHGEITGRLHSQGGERFVDHIEVEQGERWGVLNRSASRKYGTVFNKMVDSFNKDNLPIPKEMNINNIMIQNEGPNKRLDEVNSNLRQIRAKEEVIVLNGMTIYRKGNSTRVIKK